MTFRQWLQDPRLEGERRQFLLLAIVMGVALLLVILLGVLKQFQMDREQPPGEGQGTTPSPATYSSHRRPLEQV